MDVVLEKGHGKDGSPSFPYVRAHPTNYDWREDIEQLAHRIVNRDSFRGHIWINTYHHHPPGAPTTSGAGAIKRRSTCGASAVAGIRYPRSSGTECITCCSVTLTPRTSGGSSGRAKDGAAFSTRSGRLRLRGRQARIQATSTTYT
jgi:hypothetical protein